MIKIGFARVDVTPPLGTLVCGYYEERVSKGVLDPIELNAIAFGNETDTAILITADFTGMTMARITPVRARIAEVTGVPADRILITSLHQHTTIYVGDEIGDAEDFAIVRDEDYLNLLYRKFCDVAKMAVDDMAPARVFGAEKQALEPLAFTRRYVMADGVVRTNPDTRKHGTPVRHAEPSDNAVRLLRFVREGARDVVLVNFSTPKFDISCNSDLRQDLQDMGITDIFSPGKADFSAAIHQEEPIWFTAVNQATRVAIDEKGDIAAVYDKKNGRQALKESIKMAIFHDVDSYDWPSWEVKLSDMSRPPYMYPENPVITIEEEGSALCCIRIERRAGKSLFVQKISLDAESEYVSVDNEVDWREEASMLKAQFSTVASNNKAQYDIGFGYTERNTNTQRLFEVP
ncbi:MAG: hypothetical protein J6U87_06720, partial [Clostridia bacterium]|nr:hypothetical protein [Clostridia bacterium]